MNKNLLIILNGNLSNLTNKYFERLKNSNFFIIACNGGFKNCKKLGLNADLILGDLDSIEKIDSINKVIFPKEKDKSDFELAIEYGIKNGFRKFEIWGAIGDRIDHTLFNISMLIKIKKAGGEGLIYHPPYKIFLLNRENRFRKHNGGFVSFFPLTPYVDGFTIKGLKYELENEKIYMDSTKTLSNEFIGKESYVKFNKGIILAIFEEK